MNTEVAAAIAAFAPAAAELAKAGADLVSAFLREPCSEAGGLLAEQIQYIRWKNRVAVAVKGKALLEKLGLKAKPLPASFALPFFEEAGDVEDETLQDLWAGLLASAASKDVQSMPRFRKTIEVLSRDEASILLSLAKDGPMSLFPSFAGQSPGGPPNRVWVHFDWSESERLFVERTGVTASRIVLYLDHLETLDLITVDRDERLRLTYWGVEFMEACAPSMVVVNA